MIDKFFLYIFMYYVALKRYTFLELSALEVDTGTFSGNVFPAFM